jgi:hypothetical protein
MKKLSKPFYLGSIAGGVCGGIIFLFFSYVLFLFAILSGSTEYAEPFTIPLIITVILGPALFTYGVVLNFLLIYQSWQQIQEIHPRTTPGKAAGFMFIPFFNFYWVFVAYWGFARDYNKYIQNIELNIRPLNQKLFLTFCIMSVCAIILPMFTPLFYSYGMVSYQVAAVLMVGGPFVALIVIIVAVIILIIVANKMIDAVNNLREVR